MSETIYLDVGGKIFRTTKSTLFTIPYFQAMDRFNGIVGSKSEPLFIDRDPKFFRHILNFARNPDYSLPEKCKSELGFLVLI